MPETTKKMPRKIKEKAAELLRAFEREGRTFASAESCTGGLFGAAVTSVPGASKVYAAGVIAYSNEAKINLLGVSRGTLAVYGAVSREVCGEMVRGLLAKNLADFAVAVTGIAGPDSDGTDKPVGLVYIGVGRQGEEPKTQKFNFENLGRSEIREISVITMMDILEKEKQ
jgi:nicotinamide-nucleotide amidase